MAGDSLNRATSPNTIAATIGNIAATNGSITPDSLAITSGTSNVTPTNRDIASSASPTTASNSSTSTSSKKTSPTTQAQLFKKLTYHLGTTQPTLLSEIRAYRDAQTAQHKEDTKRIASLERQLALAKKQASDRDRRAAENKRADEDMIDFWTDMCNEEFEKGLKLKKENEILRKYKKEDKEAVKVMKELGDRSVLALLMEIEANLSEGEREQWYELRKVFD
jgi:uncharacterized membrane protein